MSCDASMNIRTENFDISYDKSGNQITGDQIIGD
jgi:hypothetical protein